MSTASPRPRLAPRRGAWIGPLLAAALALALHIIVLVRQRTFPFGPISRGLGDYGAQYLPFHSALAQALHGSDLISSRFNWLAGLGVSPVADYATYVSSPFNLVLAVVPLDQVEHALSWIILAKICAAAATMAALLQALAPRSSRAVPVLLGVAYACSGWVFDISIYTPQWLDGLAGFPLLCLVALWCAQRRRPLAGVLVVAIVWWANYYTAYMGSLAAALFLVMYLGGTAGRLRPAMAAVLRFATTGALGVAVTAPILLPTVMAVGRGTPFEGAGSPPLRPRVLLARMLPFTEGVAFTPALAVGSLVLVLALGLPLARTVPVRQRLAFVTGTALAFASILVHPLLIVWNAFDIPNGNPYRFSFALTGLLVICAFLTVQVGGLGVAEKAVWPSVSSMVLALAGVATLSWAAHGLAVPRLHIGDRASVWPLAFAVVAVLASLVRGRMREVLVVVVVTAALAEVPARAAYIDAQLRTFLAASPVFQTTATAQRARATSATVLAGWPTGRAGVAPWPGRLYWMSFNGGMRLGYPAVSYYSSTVPRSLSGALGDLGVGSRAAGRMLVDTADPGLDPLLGVALRSTDEALVHPQRARALPIVREVGAGSPGDPRLARTFARRNQLLGRPVYTPALVGSAATPSLTLARGESHTLHVSCPAPARLQAVIGDGEIVARWRATDGRAGEVRSPLAGVLTLPALREADVTLMNQGPTIGTVPAGGLGCLDEATLATEVATTRATPVTIRPGVVEAVFPQAVEGTVVIATSAQQGWSCHADGREVSTTERSGLLAVDVHGGRALSCGYSTPGVRAGLAIGLLALLVAVAWAWIERHRNARRGGTPTGGRRRRRAA